jgi:hypothetical protein
VSDASRNQNALPAPSSLSTPMLPAVLLDNRLADRQSESSAALLARVGGIDLAKPLEDRAPMDGGHAAAVIDDPELRPLTRRRSPRS